MRYLKDIQKRIRRRNGFTVVELIVAMGLFTILFGITSGSFINAMRTQRNLVAMVAANDSANTSLEQMAREIRTGFNFILRADSPYEGALEFTNYKGEDITYALVGDNIERGIASTFKAITADNVKIKNLKFLLCDAAAGCPTTRVTIAFGASPTDLSLASVTVNMQTTISARF